MATFIDISILQNFSSIFTFILVFVILYAMMETVKALGEDKKSLHAIVAVIIAFLVSMSSGVVAVIQNFTPWFTMLILIIFFILFAVRMFGVSNSKITDAFHNNSSILTWIIILTAVILLFSLGSGFGQKTLEQGQTGGSTVSVASGNTTVPTNTGSFNQNLYNTLYHPKVLGLILIMIIVLISMIFLTDVDKK
jgi:4-amino-4-deoxy-L-arabinose transferase-like glycosyltransferase